MSNKQYFQRCILLVLYIIFILILQRKVNVQYTRSIVLFQNLQDCCYKGLQRHLIQHLSMSKVRRYYRNVESKCCDKVMIYTVLMFVRNECVICVSMSVERHACNICLWHSVIFCTNIGPFYILCNVSLWWSCTCVQSRKICDDGLRSGDNNRPRNETGPVLHWWCLSFWKENSVDL